MTCKTFAENGISSTSIELPRKGHEDTEDERIADFNYMKGEYGNLYFVYQIDENGTTIRQNDFDAVEKRLQILTGKGF